MPYRNTETQKAGDDDEVKVTFSIPRWLDREVEVAAAGQTKTGVMISALLDFLKLDITLKGARDGRQ